MPRILVKKNLDELSRTAADLFRRIANEAIAANGAFSVALAGGSTPRSLYTLLASEEYRRAIEWSKVIFFFTDERNVAADSPESNYLMALETLLSRLDLVERQVIRWQTELGPEAAATTYEKQLYDNGPLDLVLLGLGADAHTASLFPHTSALKETDRLAMANWVEKLSDFRLTITFPSINSAADVILLVAGDDKSEAVAVVLEGEFDPDEKPGQLIRPHNGSLYWLLDEGAGRKLEKGLSPVNICLRAGRHPG